MSDIVFERVRIKVGSNTSDADSITPPANETWALEEAWIMPNASITANDTDYITARLALNDDFSTYPVCTAITSKITGGTAFTAKTKITLSLSSDKGKLLVTGSLPLFIQLVESGTGPAADLVFSFKFRRFPTA